MNLMRIAWKEIKHDFRDIRTMFFMLAFPIILMLVLGTALTGAFSGGAFDDEVLFDDIDVLYKNTNDRIAEQFKAFSSEVAQSGIYFKELPAEQNGKEQVEDGKAAGYMEISKSGVRLYVSDQGSMETSVLQGMLTAFADRYNAVMEVAKTAPEKMESINESNAADDYIQEHALQPDKQPGSMDYYAIVMTTMIALYAAMSASYLITGERILHTASRLMVAPVRKWEIFTGKVLGSIVINMACIVLVVLFSRFVFDADWGAYPGLVFLVLVTEVILAVSFGVGISYLIKSPAGPRMVIMIAVQLASFFGGAYFPLGNPEGFLQLITKLSPLTWANDAMFHMIYADDLSFILPAVGINLGIACLFLVFASVTLRRQEGL